MGSNQKEARKQCVNREIKVFAILNFAAQGWQENCIIFKSVGSFNTKKGRIKKLNSYKRPFLHIKGLTVFLQKIKWLFLELVELYNVVLQLFFKGVQLFVYLFISLMSSRIYIKCN